MANFKLKEKKLFIFDLDGTLADAYKAIEKSLNFTRSEMGFAPVSFEIVKKNIGNGDKNFVACFFSKDNLDKALAIYRAHHKKSLKKYAKLKPCARMLLYNLKRKKKLVALATNRPSYYTNIVLTSLSVKKYFDYVLCADDIKSLKPNPKILKMIFKKLNIKKVDAVFVGDMDVDMETAKRAGVDAVFTIGGSSSVGDVKSYKNKKIVYSLRKFFK
ncbi:MAG: HAD family hydrolase [Candidatus Omnitrophica bacterium]|nr:HAD family hydrolase [Candidatus Omnitrophota bacterium]